MAKGKTQAKSKKPEKKPDSATKEGADEQPKLAGGRKFLIIGLAAGLIVGGGAAASYFLFFAPKSDPVPVAEAVPPPQPEPETTAFIKVDRVSAPLVHDDRVLGYVLLDLSLEVKNHDNELVVVQKLPALRAAFLREVTREPIGKEGEPLIIDYDKLTERLRAAANQELGEEAILRVLVTQSTRV